MVLAGQRSNPTTKLILILSGIVVAVFFGIGLLLGMIPKNSSSSSSDGSSFGGGSSGGGGASGRW